MNRSGKQGLTRSRLTQNENGELGLGRYSGEIETAPHRRILTREIAECVLGERVHPVEVVAHPSGTSAKLSRS